MSDPSHVVSAVITAENQFTDFIQTQGIFNFSISGTFAATVTIQRSFDNGATWKDLENYTTPYEDVGLQPGEALVIRAGVKTGNYTSGSVILRISW